MFEHQKAPEDIKGSSEFSVVEFTTEGKSVARLCQMLSNVNFNLGVMSSPSNTVAWLNEILQISDLWERMLSVGHQPGITDEMRQLIKRTDKIREVLFEDLKYSEQAAIKMLNRLIIESRYPNETPKRIDNDDEDELIEQIFNKSNIPIEQSRILKKIYRQLFREDTQFAALIKKLYLYYLTRMRYKGDKYSEDDKSVRAFQAQEIDRELTQKVHTMFKSKYKVKTIIKFDLNDTCRLPFFANGYVKELALYIVFIPDRDTLGPLSVEEYKGALTFKGCLTMKEKVLHSYSDKDISVIHNQEELNILEEEIRNYLSDLSSNNAPAFEFALEGDIIKDDVWNVFFKTANFIENSGSNVEKVGAYIDKCDLAVQDRIFLRALLIFWSFFDKTLPDPHHLFRYHTLFELFSEDNIMKYDAWPTTAGTMKHLLIDEFQDISPEIVKWIRGVLKYLNHIGVETSLMCIGDDWQSIYGWRGSSPYYIIKYQDEFRSEPPARTMKLIENWRSYQDLLNDAESVLKKIDKNRRTDKKVECKKGKNPIEESTLDLIRGEDNDEICSTVKEVIQKATLGEKIYVLCRTKDKRNQLARSLKGLPVKVMTYHGCKGLEAHSCILVGDCAYNTSSPFKNMVYKVNGNTDRYQLTYDAAQRDEARRLAYVALTRAEKKCYWFADSRNNGCFLDLIIEKRQDEDLEPF